MTLSATIARSALLEAALKLEGGETASLPAFAAVADVHGPPMLGLLQSLRAIYARVGGTAQNMDLVLPLVREIAAYQLLTCWPRTSPDLPGGVRPAATRTVRKARDHIEAHLSRKLLLADVAEAAGVGVRGLQVAFRKELGVTPSSFILGQRLDRVRKDLQAVSERGCTIRTIAERWGFTHMGDFSRRYRAKFGESPGAGRPPCGLTLALRKTPLHTTSA